MTRSSVVLTLQGADEVVEAVYRRKPESVDVLERAPGVCRLRVFLVSDGTAELFATGVVGAVANVKVRKRSGLIELGVPRLLAALVQGQLSGLGAPRHEDGCAWWVLPKRLELPAVFGLSIALDIQEEET